MAVRIDRLVCRVSVKTGRRTPMLHAVERPVKPDMKFVQAPPETPLEAELPSSEKATEETELSGQPNPSPAAVDVRAVTDRVYELMQQEVRLARLRGSGR